MPVYRSLLDGVAEILAKPPNQRRETETKEVASWLRRKVKAFDNVSVDILMKLVEECDSEWCGANELIIREGDIGDCMYILLSGTASIYQLGDIEGDGEDRLNPTNTQDVATEETTSESPKENISGHGRSLVKDPTVLGRYVGILHSGSIFGEVALIEDCRRIASILANPLTAEQGEKSSPKVDERDKDNKETEPQECSAQVCKPSVQLVVIPRSLYDKTVRSALEDQFRLRTDFVNQVPYFRRLNSRLKKQIILSLEIQSYEFGTEVVRAGSEYRGLHYLIEGELSISVQPRRSVAKQRHRQTTCANLQPTVLFYLRDKNPMLSSSHGTTCLGDMELLLGACPYLFTARTTTESRLLFMSKRNAQRYFMGVTGKRATSIPKTIRSMQLALCKEALMKLEYRMNTFPKLAGSMFETVVMRLNQLAEDQSRVLKRHESYYKVKKNLKMQDISKLEPSKLSRQRTTVESEDTNTRNLINSTQLSTKHGSNAGQNEDKLPNASSSTPGYLSGTKHVGRTRSYYRQLWNFKPTEDDNLHRLLNSEREHSNQLQSKVTDFVKDLHSFIEKQSSQDKEFNPFLIHTLPRPEREVSKSAWSGLDFQLHVARGLYNWYPGF